jgi:chromatin segregation and condensation protein Rec8/ScpA/Scc1 (kleisin family)
MDYETRTIHERIVSLEEQVEAIAKRLQDVEKTSLLSLSQGQGRSEAILNFLAILHLARDQIITLEQSIHFSDIMISRREKTSSDSAVE